MFGSGDDKKTSQSASNAETPETVDSTADQSATKPVKKGLFSWFSKKAAEPQVADPNAVESTVTETSTQSVEPQQAGQAPSVAEPQSAPSTLNAEVKPTPVEQVIAPVNTLPPAVIAPVAQQPVESVITPVMSSTAPFVEPVENLVAESVQASLESTATVEAAPTNVSVTSEFVQSSTAVPVQQPPTQTTAPVAEPVLPSASVIEQPEQAAAVAPILSSQSEPTSTASVEPARPAFSRFRISGGSEVVVPPAPVIALVEPEFTAEVDVEADEPKLDANLSGQDKPQDNKANWFARLKEGLAKTSSSLGEGMASLFLGKKEIDDDLLDELETRLLTADVGMEATTEIMGNLTRRVARKELAHSGALYQALQVEMADLLRPIEQPMQITGEKKPYVILVVGVNGAGKTTTIGKLAARLQKEGKKVMLAAGDTFRAAAVEQLQVWGERNKIPVIAQHTGADSASVIFDAVQAAKSRGMDVLIADTAGRLHTKDNLMEELRKVGRVMSKLDDSAPHEVLLVLDAGTGQNAINQTRQFNETIPLTGLALTKLDGTAKGGVIFALAKHFKIPVRYIGVGEGIDDLRDFVADDFVKALFAEKDSA